MSLLGLPPLRPNFDAAVRDVAAKNPAMRIQAAERLGDATDEERALVATPLRTMLADRDARVRAAAIEACGRVQSSELVGEVIARINDADPLVREVAVVALARLGGVAATAAVRDALTSEHAETRFQAAMSYVELCPDDAEPLRPLIHDEDPMVRIHTVQALVSSADPLAATLLAECWGDHNPQVRRRVAIAFAGRGDGRGLNDVLLALNDAELVFDALDALGHLGDKSAGDAIAHLAAGLLQPLVVKATAGAALARLGDPRGVEVLRRVLRAWRADGRSVAVEFVGNLRLRPLLPELTRLVEAPRGTDLPTLARALAAFGRDDPGAVEPLRRMAGCDTEAGAIARLALAEVGK